MNLADKLNALIADKEAMRTAITGKGVAVETTEPLSGYAAKIDEIPNGSVISAPIPSISFTTNLLVGENFPILKTINAEIPASSYDVVVATGTTVSITTTLTAPSATLSLITSVTAQ